MIRQISAALFILLILVPLGNWSPVIPATADPIYDKTGLQHDWSDNLTTLSGSAMTNASSDGQDVSLQLAQLSPDQHDYFDDATNLTNWTNTSNGNGEGVISPANSRAIDYWHRDPRYLECRGDGNLTQPVRKLFGHILDG